MSATRTYTALAIGLLMSATLWSQTAPDQALTLEQCLTIALEQNPLVLSSMQREKAAMARIEKATAYPFPSIDFNSDLEPQPLNFAGTRESYLGVSQALELPRKRTNRGEIAESESREVGMDTELLKREIAFLVKEAFYELLLVKEKIIYAKQNQELAEDYLQKAQLKLAAGDVAQVEVLRARVEGLRAANAVKVAISEESLAKARLNFFLARRKTAPLEIVGQLQRPFLELDLNKLQQEAFSRRPELKRLSYSIERESRIREGARLSIWPDLGVNLSHHYLQGDPTSWSFSVSVPLSFLFRQRQKAEIAEAQANISSLQREVDHMRDTIVMEVEEACTNAQTARDQILLYKDEVLPQAEEAYNMFLFSYQEGEIGGIELIEARKTLNEARKAYADALYGYAVTLASLDKAIGR